jgi:hypothetical protein
MPGCNVLAAEVREVLLALTWLTFMLPGWLCNLCCLIGWSV